MQSNTTYYLEKIEVRVHFQKYKLGLYSGLRVIFVDPV